MTDLLTVEFEDQTGTRPRIEARIALDEVLTRFPDWDVDLDDAALSPASTVRGWERLPMLVTT